MADRQRQRGQCGSKEKVCGQFGRNRYTRNKISVMMGTDASLKKSASTIVAVCHPDSAPARSAREEKESPRPTPQAKIRIKLTNPLRSEGKQIFRDTPRHGSATQRVQHLLAVNSNRKMETPGDAVTAGDLFPEEQQFAGEIAASQVDRGRELNSVEEERRDREMLTIRNGEERQQDVGSHRKCVACTSGAHPETEGLREGLLKIPRAIPGLAAIPPACRPS